MKRLVALWFLVCASSATHATFFYRMDTRPPEDIFQNGFTPSGGHPSLFQHVIGQTCQAGAQTTGFVAVSSNETFAVNWGRENVAEGGQFYVYRIRASPQFYNAAQSLFYARRQTNNAAYEQAGWVFMAESEWVTPAAIPPQDIVGAAEYVSRGRELPPGRVGVFIPPGADAAPGTLNHEPFVWNYTLDAHAAPLAFNPLCPSVCFNTENHLSKRSVVEWQIGDEVDEARRKADHILECVGMTASAAFGIDLFAPGALAPRESEPPKTEL